MHIKPFKALLYNPGKVNIGDVVSPPYDIIDHNLQEILYQKSPYNAVRLTYGKSSPADTDSNSKYTRAAKFLSEFIEEKVLLEDDTHKFYLHLIEFIDPLTSQNKQLFTIIATLDIEQSSPHIYPHENVFEAPIVDRINLLHSTNANFGSIYILYEDKEQILEQRIFSKVVKEKPIHDFTSIDNTHHKLYNISSQEDIVYIENFVKNKDGFIADGHHRYFAALKYYEYCKAKGLDAQKAKYRLVTLANAYNQNLLILPTHRIVYKKGTFNSLDEFYSLLVKNYEIKEITQAVDYNIIKNEILEMNKHSLISFLIYLNGFKKLFKVSSRFLTDYNKILSINASNRLKNINTTVLHHLILPLLYDLPIDKMKVPEDIDFSKSLTEAVAKCSDEKVDSVMFLSSMKVEDLIFIAKLGEKIPPKTTYFYPKLPTGLVIYKF